MNPGVAANYQGAASASSGGGSGELKAAVMSQGQKKEQWAVQIMVAVMNWGDSNDPEMEWISRRRHESGSLSVMSRGAAQLGVGGAQGRIGGAQIGIGGARAPPKR